MYVWVRNRQILILPEEPVCKEQLLKANRAVTLSGSDRRTGSQIVERELGRCLLLCATAAQYRHLQAFESLTKCHSCFLTTSHTPPVSCF